MHDYRISASELSDFLKLLSRGPLDTIPGINVVSKQRQALLPFGAVVLSEILRAGKPSCVKISALGLREGLLYSKLSPDEQAQDPLLSAAQECPCCARDRRSTARNWSAGRAKRWQRSATGENAEEQRLRTAACLLSDIGWRAHPDYRGLQSLNILSNAAFVGVDHAGRMYLSLAVYYRHSGLTDDDSAPASANLRRCAIGKGRGRSPPVSEWRTSCPGLWKAFCPEPGCAGPASAWNWCCRLTWPISAGRGWKAA
jgi:exopolyphosphatase/guanosine-5'-triphosphate,3'-diphosphate pyrophosphatase